LGESAIYSALLLIEALTRPKPLSQQTTTLNPSATPGRPWLDLAFQLNHILVLVIPALLALYLLNGAGDAARQLGLDRRRPRFDLGTGIGLAAVIGIPGLGLYLGARQLNLNLTVEAADLTSVWWAAPVLILAAAANALLEEVVVVGYLVTRLGQLNWRPWGIVAASALLRGSYHLYQGFGGFVGNAIMGVVFALFFMKTRRVLPLVVAHTLLDVVAFVGYTLVHNHVSWL